MGNCINRTLIFDKINFKDYDINEKNRIFNIILNNENINSLIEYINNNSDLKNKFYKLLIINNKTNLLNYIKNNTYELKYIIYNMIINDEYIKYLENKKKLKIEEDIKEDLIEKINIDLNLILDKLTCSLCMDNELNICLMECGHLFCNDCIDNIIVCPICRKNITKKISIYI